MIVRLIGILFVLIAVGIIPIQYPTVGLENLLPAIAGRHDAYAVTFTGSQTAPEEWDYNLTYNPSDNYATCESSATITLTGLVGVTSASGPTSTDFAPAGSGLDTINLAWTPTVLNGGTKIVWTHIGPGTGNFPVDKHVFGFKVFANANNGTVNLATGGFEVDQSKSGCPTPNNRDIVATSSGPATPATIPAAPTELIGTTAHNEIDLYWNPTSSNDGSPIKGYEIERSTDGGSSWTIAYYTKSTVAKYQDTKFDPGTTYTYRVFAINAEGTSDPSNTASVTSSNGSATTDDKFVIRFKSGAFTPPFGIINKTAIKDGHDQNDTVHFLLQFIEIPNSTDRKNIAQLGIALTDYVTGNTYIAAAKVSDLGNLDNISMVRWAGPFLSEYKISQILKTNNLKDIPKWAVVNKPGFYNQVVLTIDLNKGANLDDVANNIVALGGTIEAKVPIIPSITVYIDLNKVNDIANLDDVQFVSPVDPPLYETNDKARMTAGVGPPLVPINGLTGVGVTVLVYDGGVADFHPDFGVCSLPLVWPLCHIIDIDPSSSVADHATHVAGTVGGSGVWSSHFLPLRSFEGMAPHVAIKSYGFNPPSGVALPEFNDQSDINNDFTKAITTGNRIDLATMSLGIKVAAFPACLPTYLLGEYGPTSKTIDAIVTGNISRYPLIFFEAAGNNRVNTNGCTDSLGNLIHYPDFASIDPPATAKDSIAVGAINTNDYSLWEKTSFGPTVDGRLKPDITAPGCTTDIDAGIISTRQSNEYMPMCGTSQATPVAAGVAALLIEKWHLFHSNITPLPDTVKAILVHTAVDLGNSGPDYKFGWGAINAKAVISLILDDQAYNVMHAGHNMINMDHIDTGQSPKSFYFVSDGKDDVKATLVWDDPPSTQLPVPTLINQLDLHLKAPNGQIYEPFLLNPDPLHRDDVATRGNDNVNVVKMVNGSAQIGTWTAIVDAANVTSGPQNFTLIISPEYKRTISITVTPWSPDPPIVKTGDHGTVNATVSDDNYGGTPITPNGTVNFFDGTGLALSSLGCSHISGNLVCTADYSPSSIGDYKITANYTGDGPHSKNSNDITVHGKCLIATAAFGSELSPQVQFLREFRDNHLLKTSAGSSFMGVFNTWYYSFSPYVADYEYQHSWFQQTVKVSLYPLLGILQVSQKAFYLFDGNYGAMIAGMVAVSLIGAVYVSPIAICIKKVRNTKFNYRITAYLFSVLIISAIGSILIGNYYAIVTTSLLFLLALITVSAILSAKLILRIINMNSKHYKENKNSMN